MKFQEKNLEPEHILWYNLKGDPFLAVTCCVNLWSMLLWILRISILLVIHAVLLYVVLETEHILDTNVECPQINSDEFSFKEHLYMTYKKQVESDNLLS